MGRGKKKRGQNGGSTDSDSSFNTSGVTDRVCQSVKKQKQLPPTAQSGQSDVSFVFAEESGSELPSAEGNDRQLKGNNLAMADGVDGLASPTLPAPVTNEQLMLQLQANGREISRLTDVVGELRGLIHELQVSNDSLTKQVEESKKREEALKQETSAARDLANVALRRADELDQYIRRNNMRIYGVGEEGEDKDPALCESKIMDIIHNKLDLKDVSPRDIEAVHRLGKESKRRTTAGKAVSPRGIIVRCVSRKTRDSILYRRKKLKNSGVSMVEDLTQTNYHLLQRVKEYDLCKSAWTKNGKVMMESKTGRVTWIKCLADLTDDKIHSYLSSAPRQPRGGQGSGSDISSMRL
ncbi:hypothetical protein BaRGS_00015938 [Batillaria attramentaria]|uniref:Uncharacterized protein n=1 Tax=Batillaria attramentaria TaxID=370345 RepID=A0ABD0KZY8_9CAEN